MTAAVKPVHLTCSECDGRFDEHWQPLGADDLLASEQRTYGAVCPPCSARLTQERRIRDLPQGMVGLHFDTLDRSGDRAPAIEAAERWGRRELQGLLLHGTVGTGKTRTAATAMNERARHEPVAWVSVPRLLTQALAGIDSDDRREALKALTRAGTLVLDDLDKVKPSEWALSQLFLLIDQRVNEGSGLLVTTNLAPLGLVQTMGEPIASRLGGYCDVRHMGGGDRRFA